MVYLTVLVRLPTIIIFQHFWTVVVTFVIHGIIVGREHYLLQPVESGAALNAVVSTLEPNNLMHGVHDSRNPALMYTVLRELSLGGDAQRRRSSERPRGAPLCVVPVFM